MKISVIMPVYNVETYLDRSILSILGQTYTNWELIIVNDGSTDASEQVIKKYLKDESRIKYIYQENSGSGSARNKGLDNSTGAYICFIDPDDWIESDALKNNAEYISEYQPEVIVNGYIKDTRSKKNENLLQLEGLLDQKQFRENYSQYKYVGERALWNKLYSKAFIDKNSIRFTDQRVGQDAVFNFDVYTHLNRVYLDNRAYYHYNATREGSAIRSYRADRMELENNVATAYEKMFKAWDLEKRYEYDIKISYWNVVFRELINISRKDSELGETAKQKKIVELREDISYEVLDIDGRIIQSRFSRLIFILFKNKRMKLMKHILDIVVNRLI